MFQSGMARTMWPEGVSTGVSSTATSTPQPVSETEVMKSSGSPIGSDNGKDGKERNVFIEI